MLDKELHIAVVGLGYVGRPLAGALARHFHVVGYDTDTSRSSCTEQDIVSCNVYIIAVPTPLSVDGLPDLSYLMSATSMVGRMLKRGDIVVFESTVFPGCTEEECIPMLEQISGMRCVNDFGVGYSPERVNPGDDVHRLDNVVKIISASDKHTLSVVEYIYGRIVSAGLHVAPSIRVAEAAKLIENTQRDVNIALVNELSLALERMGISTADVLDAASTKWNFHRYSPGLVGGYCIGVSPRYLSYKSALEGYSMRLVNTACSINEMMVGHVAHVVVKHLVSMGRPMAETRTLVMGVTYKEDVSDVRNSMAMAVVAELKAMGVADIVVYDPHADSADVQKLYSLSLTSDIDGVFDAIVIPVAHSIFYDLVNQTFVNRHLRPDGLLADVKNVSRGRVSGVALWRL